MQKKSKIPVVCGILCVSLVGGFAYYVKNPDILLNINKNNEGTYQEYEATDEDMDFVNKYTKQDKNVKYDKNGHPYLKPGQKYSFKDNGMGEPVEAPKDGKYIIIKNPNTGIEYSYLPANQVWYDERIAKAENERAAKISRGEMNALGEVGRPLTQEEANSIHMSVGNFGSIGYK